MGDSSILIEVAIAHQKLLRLLEVVGQRLPDEYRPRTLAQWRYYDGTLRSLLAESGLQLASGDGAKLEARTPVEGLSVDDSTNSKVLVGIAVEHWKLLRALEVAIERLPYEHHSRTVAQWRYFEGRLRPMLAECGLRLETFDGQRFEPNLPVTALNADEFTDGGPLVVDVTVEPAVIENMVVLHLGKVVVKRIAEDGGNHVSGN